MKIILHTLLILSLLPLSAAAQRKTVDATSEIRREGDSVKVSMVFDLSPLRIKGATSLVLTPFLQAADRIKELPSVEVMSRSRYLHYLRSREDAGRQVFLRFNGAPQQISYEASFAYEEWMDAASLYLSDSRHRCCRFLMHGERTWLSESGLAAVAPPAPVAPPDPLPEPAPVPVPEREVVFELRYAHLIPELSPEHLAKTRSVSGSALVGFGVNRWDVREDYGMNVIELDKIRRSIDSVRFTPDVTLLAIRLKGFASPESSWSHNALLAKNRTLALKRYISERFGLPESMIHTDYEPEDWAGLRRYVAQSHLPHRSQLLEIIDSDLHPDRKEERIRSLYPAEYRILYTDCYPSLRHTEYQVDYRIKSYTEIGQLREAFDSRPSNLSLEEFHHLASASAPGSEAFYAVYRIAFRFYPDDEAVRVNAANAALSSGDWAYARALLDRAGDSPEADNARGILAWFSGDRDEASRYFLSAADGGCAAAAANAVSIIHTIIKQ